MPYKAVIFDLDGTLLDTLEDLGSTMNKVLRDRGFPIHDINTYRYFVGNGVTMLVTRSLPQKQRFSEMIRECVEAFHNDYEHNWHKTTRPYDGVPEMLDELSVQGVKMAILSNKPHEFVKHCVSEILKRWSFDMVFGHKEGFALKPDPHSALEIARVLNIASHEILYLGDTGTDMKTARAAGMFSVGALWGFRSAEELEKAGAQALLEKPQEILRFFSDI